MAKALTIENISKKYIIGHREEAYLNLRDKMALSAKAACGKLIHPLSGNRKSSGTREEFWALKDVSFSVEQGERIGIIGRNGAGKSTLLKILSRITEPTDGRIEITGRVASLLEVGTGFHPELTGRENVFLNGAILGMTRAEIRRKFDAIVEFAEIEKFLDTPVKRYSSGMYVRLAFAVAAHLEPEMLLVDEVLAVGDASFQKKCLGKMGEISEDEGRTVLFISHNMAAISQLCRRAVWLDHGQVRVIGEVAAVVESYIAEGSSSLAERIWTYPGNAPGDDLVRLLGCRILQESCVSPVIDINRPAEVEMDFVALHPARNLISGVSFYTAEGTCIFNCCDWRAKDLDPGRYVKRVEIPAQFLAEGLTSVLVQLVQYEPDRPSVVMPGALLFEAIDSDHPLAVRGQYKGAWPGVVRVGLKWSDFQYYES